MPRNLFVVAALLAQPWAALEARAACTAANPNANVIETTPTGAFTNHGDGTLTRGLSGLMRKRCAQGFSGAARAAHTCMTRKGWFAPMALPLRGLSTHQVRLRQTSLSLTTFVAVGLFLTAGQRRNKLPKMCRRSSCTSTRSLTGDRAENKSGARTARLPVS